MQEENNLNLNSNPQNQKGINEREPNGNPLLQKSEDMGKSNTKLNKEIGLLVLNSYP